MNCKCGNRPIPRSHLCWACRDKALDAVKCRTHVSTEANPGDRVYRRTGEWRPEPEPQAGKRADPPSVRYAANLERMKGKR